MGNTVSDYLFGGNEQGEYQNERDRPNITPKRRLNEGVETSPPDRKKTRTGASTAPEVAATPLTGSSSFYDDCDQFADAAESEDDFFAEHLGSDHHRHRHHQSDNGVEDDRKFPASPGDSDSHKKHRSKKHKKKKKKKKKHKDRRSTSTSEASSNSLRKTRNEYEYADTSQRDAATDAATIKDAMDPNVNAKANSNSTTVLSTRGPPVAELPKDRQLLVDKRSKVKRPRSSLSYYMEDHFAHLSERYPGFSKEEMKKVVESEFERLTPRNKKAYDDMAKRDSVRYSLEMELIQEEAEHEEKREHNNHVRGNKLPPSSPASSSSSSSPQPTALNQNKSPVLRQQEQQPQQQQQQQIQLQNLQRPQLVQMPNLQLHDQYLLQRRLEQFQLQQCQQQLLLQRLTLPLYRIAPQPQAFPLPLFPLTAIPSLQPLPVIGATQSTIGHAGQPDSQPIPETVPSEATARTDSRGMAAPAAHGEPLRTNSRNSLKLPDRKHGAPHTPQPARTSFMMFSIVTRPQLMRENPSLTATELSTTLEAMYRALPAKEKERYDRLALEDNERYQNEIKQYNRHFGKISGKEGDEKRRHVQSVRPHEQASRRHHQHDEGQGQPIRNDLTLVFKNGHWVRSEEVQDHGLQSYHIAGHEQRKSLWRQHIQTKPQHQPPHTPGREKELHSQPLELGQPESIPYNEQKQGKQVAAPEHRLLLKNQPQLEVKHPQGMESNQVDDDTKACNGNSDVS